MLVNKMFIQIGNDGNFGILVDYSYKNIKKF